MKLVEIIKGLQTSQETYDKVLKLTESMGKTTVISRDSPGFIINRILMPYINEAIQTLHEGIASVDDINNGMKLGT
jgi:3-hydroxybutyryl-CoA dehydrogenase